MDRAGESPRRTPEDPMPDTNDIGDQPPNYCSHCGDTTTHCPSCGACPGGHWGGCTR